MPEPLLDLRPDYLQIVRGILKKHVPEREVWAFGSRATWRAKPYSDLDLAVMGEQPLSLSQLAALTDDFADSDLPFRVDVVDWATTRDNFRLIIERNKVVVQEADGGADCQSAFFIEECQKYCVKIADGTHDSPKQSITGKPLVTSKNIKNSRLNLENAYLISDRDFDEINKRSKVDQWDILLSMIGTVGEVCCIDEVNPNFAIKNVGLLKCGDRLKAKWLFYYLISPVGKTLIEHRIKGSTQQYISLGEIRRLPVSYPSDQQTMQGVVDLLSNLDDRITLLRETNTLLEQIAQTIFKSWFVDFDPVRAKQEGRIPEGMDEDTAALFPDSFEESELGLVPRGWRAGILGDLAQLNPQAWTARNHPPTIAYIDLANVKENVIASITNYTFDEAPSRAKRVLQSGDTIVGTVRPGNKSFALIWSPPEYLTGSTGFAALRPVFIENTEYIYLAATQESSIDKLAHLADGAAYPAVRPDVVASIQCPIPTTEVMEAFHEVVAPLLIRNSENHNQAQILAELRDTLLPRLISGKLRLPEAEDMIEEANV